MNLKGIIPWIIVAVLAVLLVWSLNVDSGEPTVIERHTTDTLTIVKTDTMYITKVVTKTKDVKDTVYITIRDSILAPVPRTEYNFSEKGVFDFNVKGYDVEFLGATVYPKTVYERVVSEKQTTVTKYKSSLFVNAGFSSICGTISPQVGISLSLKGKWLISGDLGLYNKNPYVGAKVGYNILQK